MFRRILALIIKELQAQFRDPKSRQLLIVPVIVQICIFPFAATLEVKNVSIAVFNQDSGAASIEIMQRFSMTKFFSKPQITHSVKEIREAIDNQRVLLALVFPIDFSRNIAAGKPASVQLIIDGRRSNSAQISASYIQEIIDSYQRDIQIQSASQSLSSPISIRNWFNSNLDYKWFILPGLIGLISSIGCLGVTSMAIAREREQGTLEQLFVSPLSPGSIMTGKIIPAVIIAIMQSTIILIACIYFYGIAFQGSLFLLYFCLFFYALSLAGVGLLISISSNNQQQALIGVFGFLVPAILLSGYIAPIENIPEPLQSFTWINPFRHFIEISKGVYLKGLDFTQVWHNLWPLFVIAFVTLSLSYVIFRSWLK